MATALLAYAKSGYGWYVFASGSFVPDLPFAGYLFGPRAGAAVYNDAHSYVGAGLTLMAYLLGARPECLAIGLLWSAHVGFDRTMGYGLKYRTGFASTHLGRIGKG